MSVRHGYGRISTNGSKNDMDSLEAQKSQLLKASCTNVVLERFTGASMSRPKFDKLVAQLRPGDTIVFTRIDRFARTTAEALVLIDGWLANDIAIEILNMGRLDNTPMGRLTYTVFLAFAEFDRRQTVERLADGKARAQANNPHYREGRKPLELSKGITEPDILLYRQKIAQGQCTAKQAAAELGISRASWYNLNARIGA